MVVVAQRRDSTLFCASLADYSLPAPDSNPDSGETCLHRALTAFAVLASSDLFGFTTTYVIPTSFTAFAAAVPRAPLARRFPDYTGGPNPIRAAWYVVRRFSSRRDPLVPSL
ncbi:hypothetical protein K488DRAFT_92732 [Vararia minispora EC-137]|uniref:Uncharacterized protein n=1 Tax=Vararia minispora EC-137 TaxID=1314806 RepID=A0ACB8Q3Z5_9AGAM|nr:hypothetical protein K488DRAFT_92732 [Vararia minispora EC-137]